MKRNDIISHKESWLYLYLWLLPTDIQKQELQT